jgi:trimeric autotransporter adhesin
MKRHVLFLFFMIVFAGLLSCGGTYWGHWGTNGTVNTTLVHNNKVYLGGSFTQVMANTGGGAAVDLFSGMLLGAKKVPYIDGGVYAVVPDGKDGWYIGGGFTTINGQARHNIARIKADGSLHPWNPDANDAVTALVLSGKTLYVGGDFTQIGGKNRSHIAALSVSKNTRNATAWNPNANGSVRALLVDGTTVYAGGDFVGVSSIGGADRNFIAALDATKNTVNATAWNPRADDTVRTLAISGTTMYAGGDFGYIGVIPRNFIAAIDTTTGIATAWNPNATNIVMSLAVSGTTVYVAGAFSGPGSIGGAQRNFIAALDATVNTSNATAWNPDASGVGIVGPLYSVVVSGSTVYVGGRFTHIGGVDRNYIAALDATTGNAMFWNPGADNTVFTIAVTSNAVYFGGVFSFCCFRDRNNIASVDLTNGRLTDWDPDANNAVLSLATSGSTIYAGGAFSHIGGQDRMFIAALDENTITNNATDWDPHADGTVLALAVSGTTVYAGGTFMSMNAGADTRHYIAALDANGDGVTVSYVTPWDPNAGDLVNALAISGTTVYAGGNFVTMNGGLNSRHHIAALDATVNFDNATAWDPSADDVVYSLAVSKNTVYAGGKFKNIGGQPRNYIAALSAAADTNNATAWDPNATTGTVVNTVTVTPSAVYAGGDFTHIGGQDRNYIAALNVKTGAATAWDPNAGNLVRCISVSDNNVFAGGDFAGIGNYYISHFLAGIDAKTGLLIGW